jgi:hypothetical protein
MTTTNLSSALMGSVANTRKIGHEMVRIYGDGSHRVLSAVDRQFWKLMATPAKRLNAPLHARMESASKQVVGLAHGGVKMAATGARKAVDTVFDATEAALTTIGKRMPRLERVRNPYASRVIHRLEGAGLAGAKFGRGLTGRVADRAARLAEAVAIKSPHVATKKRQRKARA